jgi:O-antigen/teichoic acid export membrane protein
LSTHPPTKPNNAQTIARNSVWFGMELLFGLSAAFLTSVLVARVIGPQRLGYFQYLVWLTNITTSVGSVGLPMTTRKYMAECLNRGEPSVARAIYRTGLRLQILIAFGITLIALALVFLSGDPSQRLISVLLVINVAPRMIGLIPSQANNAAELMKRSTPPALIGGVLNVGLTLVSLWVGWGLPGVALGIVAGAVVETGLKLYDVHRRMVLVPMGRLSPELKKRMLSYSSQGLVLMLLNVVVWDRSDLVILKSLNSDIRQVTFFSLAFNVTERVLMIPNAFMTSLGVTMMAQYGRGVERLSHLVIAGTKYSVLIALPLLIGVACLSQPMVSLLYGDRYAPLVPVLAICALLAIPKALIAPPTALLQATENQSFLIWVACCCGALDILLDVLLTPGYGARGAALANGLAQTTAAIAIWVRVRGLFRLDLRLGEFGRVAFSGAAMAAVTLLITHWLPTYAGVALAFCAAVVVWFVSLRVTRAVAKPDGERLLNIGRVLPSGLRPAFARLVSWLANGALTAA